LMSEKMAVLITVDFGYRKDKSFFWNQQYRKSVIIF
jgi:hypothetical protein